MKTLTTSSILTKAIGPVGESLNRSAWRSGILLIALVLAWFAVSPMARADSNTAYGDNALLNNTGIGNSAFGAAALEFNTSASYSTAVGQNALQNNLSSIAAYNTAIGWSSLGANFSGYGNTATGYQALFGNISGILNTANGGEALYNNNGSNNTATGAQALYNNSSGYQNTATGAGALTSNSTAWNNTAIGFNALFSNSTGHDNTATGAFALGSDPESETSLTGSYNTANGSGALQFNTEGHDNTANGVNALNQNTTGGDNTATGSGALLNNISGVFNTADGAETLVSNLTGNDNAASGVFSLFYNTTGNDNTAYGYLALFNNATGSSNIALGHSAGSALTTGSNNIDIGNAGGAGESAKIRIGTKGTHRNTYIAGIYGVTATRGVGVFIDSNGHLGTTTSSARFKEAIKPMDEVSEAILALKPMSFRYKPELDPEGIPQFGLIAEEVEKVNPDLVARDDQGKAYTVRYEAVNAMLLNEFLKEHRKVEEQVRANQEQQANIAELKSAVAAQRDKTKALEVMLAEQAAQIRKVSAQLAASDQSALRIVANDQSTTK